VTTRSKAAGSWRKISRAASLFVWGVWNELVGLIKAQNGPLLILRLGFFQSVMGPTVGRNAGII
jgi:hypothetical protein